MKRKPLKIALVLLFVALIVCFFIFDLGRYLDFKFLQEQKDLFVTYYQNNQILTLTIYFVIYVVVTALSLPGAAILTLFAGGLFGLVAGTILVSFASTLGATLAFLSVRFILRDSIQAKFGSKLKTINEGIEREGAFYLFTLRLVPAFPFFLINMLMGLTPIKTLTFFIVSQIGMLPGTLVYVNAGTQLAKIDPSNPLAGILSPQLLISFVILGLFPIAAKKALALFKKKPKEEKIEKV